MTSARLSAWPRRGWDLLTSDDPVFWLRCALVVVAQFGFVRAVRYGLGNEQLPRALDVVSSYVPIEVWGAAWAVAGLSALAAVPHAKPIGSLPAIGLGLGFALGYTITWLNPPVGPPPPGSPGPGDYVSASSYWTVSLLMWCGYNLSRIALAKGSPSPGAT